MSGPGINHNKRTFFEINVDTCRWNDTNQTIIDRAGQCAAINQHFAGKMEHIGGFFGRLFLKLFTSLAEYIPEKNIALPGINTEFKREEDRV